MTVKCWSIECDFLVLALYRYIPWLLWWIAVTVPWHKCEEQHGISKRKQCYNVCLDSSLSTHLELTYCWMVNKSDVLDEFFVNIAQPRKRLDVCRFYCPHVVIFIDDFVTCFFHFFMHWLLHVLWEFMNYRYWLRYEICSNPFMRLLYLSILTFKTLVFSSFF